MVHSSKAQIYWTI